MNPKTDDQHYIHTNMIYIWLYMYWSIQYERYKLILKKHVQYIRCMLSSLKHVRLHKRIGNGGLQVNGENNTSIVTKDPIERDGIP